MSRKLAIWLSWHNHSEYYSRMLAKVLRPEYETTITYKALDWSQFDVVMPYFPGPHRNPECERGKIVKFIRAYHEAGWARDAATVCAPSLPILERIEKRYKQGVHLLHWGVNPEHFHPQPWPEGDRLIVGWAGQYKNPYKRFDELKAQIDTLDGVGFVPALSHTARGGRQSGEYKVSKMARYYRRIHVYVCGSSWEGLCFPLLEACACGRPVVTFDVGVARDLKRTGAGVVIVDDWDALKRAVRSVDWMALGAASAEAVHRHWLWSRLRARWLEVLDGAG